MTTKVPRRKKPRDKQRLAVLRWDEEHNTVKLTPVHPFENVYYVSVVGSDLEVLAKGERGLRDAVLGKTTLKKAR